MPIRPALVAAVLLGAVLAFAPRAARADARPPAPLDAAQLGLAIRKLGVLESVLYVGAHPDDENTGLLAYLTRERLARVAYLSLTRGDGGQNLLGGETGEALGVIRTQELLEARRVDGAEQMFTRAVDFGFSKSPDEALAFWGRDSVLADVVWAIRRFRPDVIVTRFPTDGSGGHGHHTASALLAEEAFHAAADPQRFPEQLALGVQPWQAKRILWNAWADSLGGLPVDVGRYNPVLGRSYTEIAAESRSMHKSQGFGSAGRRGSIPTWFALRGGEPATRDLFDGVVATWARVPKSAAVAAAVAEAVRGYDPAHPAASLAALVKVHRALATLGDDPWATTKRAEVESAIRSAAGLWLEASADRPSASPGGKVKVTALALNRSSAPLVLERLEMPFAAPALAPMPPKPGSGGFSGTAAVADQGPGGAEVKAQTLPENRAASGEATLTLPADAPTSQPYWLEVPASAGLFRVADPKMIGRPESPPALVVRAVIRVLGESMTFAVPVTYRSTDPVLGERVQRFEIVPPVTLALDEAAYLFPDAAPRDVRLTVTSGDAAFAGTAHLALPEGWKSDPPSAPVQLAGPAATQTVVFHVTPGATPAAATLHAWVEKDGRRYDRGRERIDYPHIGAQTLFPPADAHLVRADVRHVGDDVAYVAGSGDAIPDALRQIGYRVTALTDDELASGALARFASIVIGVRAYNTRPALRAQHQRLMDYVAAGGTLVVQYNTADDALKDQIGPYPFTISRDRVAVEDAPVRLLQPDHALLARPNRITPDDFAGWVQERGLNFASPWDPRYETVLSANDPGEPPRDGGLLVAKFGKGVFIDTSYSWFRQLPAGVPGAYRLFANLVSARP